MSLFSRIRDTVVAVARAVRNPASYAPPPLPTTPPPERPARDRGAGGAPGVTRRPARPRGAPPQRPAPSRPISRDQLPASWGANKAALWQDATKSEPRLARDERAQDFYDAAMYSFSESHDVRSEMYANFVEYLEDEYGIDWEELFDWDSWREEYDTSTA